MFLNLSVNDEIYLFFLKFFPVFVFISPQLGKFFNKYRTVSISLPKIIPYVATF